MAHVSETYRCDPSDPDASRRADGLDAATREIRNGRLVVLPTDTVYGVAADAFDPAAVRRLLRAKGRGRDMPPPVLVGSPDLLDTLTLGLVPVARDLAEKWWPGPLTLICPEQPSLTWDLGDAAGTVAVRMPDHELALELLRATGPLAVSSANRSGLPAAVEAAEAEEMLGDAVGVYLDGGRSPGLVASTILDVTGPVPRVLRAGAVPVSALREIAPDVEGPE